MSLSTQSLSLKEESLNHSCAAWEEAIVQFISHAIVCVFTY